MTETGSELQRVTRMIHTDRTEYLNKIRIRRFELMTIWENAMDCCHVQDIHSMEETKHVLEQTLELLQDLAVAERLLVREEPRKEKR